MTSPARQRSPVESETLAFVARRLLAERIALVFAVREPNDDHELTGLPGLVGASLRDGDARVLLDSAIPGRLDERVLRDHRFAVNPACGQN